MRLLFLFAISLSFALVSCQNSEGPVSCGVENPVQDLPWLKEKVEELAQSDFSQYFFVEEAKYEGNTVFVFQNCCPFCNSVVSVYSCEGVLLGYLSDQNSIKPSKLSFVRIAWKSANSTCNFQS